MVKHSCYNISIVEYNNISFYMEVSNMITFILGMMLGGFLGVTYLALCIVGSRGERDYIE